MKLKGSCHCQAVKFEVESLTPYPFMYCYCSICRKTAGGGGYAINIMGQAETLVVKGKQHVQIYHAVMGRTKQGKVKRSTGARHFCKKCASCLWVSDPAWPELVHPFASAIDTPLPKPPARVHLMVKFAPEWVEIPTGRHEKHFDKYPDLSIEEWHKNHKLYSA